MFCNKCGSQIPDGSVACTNCGAPTGVAPQPKAPSNGAFVNLFANGFNKAALLGSGNSIDIISLVMAVVGLICIFLPGVKGGDENFSIISTTFAYVSEVTLMALIIPFMAALIVLYVMKKQFLAFWVTVSNFLFTLIVFCVAINNIKDRGGKTGWGLIFYFIWTILIVVMTFLWPTIHKAMKNRPVQQVVYVQQAPYAQPYAQAPVQQPYAQAPVQQAPQAPVQQAPVQPQQPQQPQQ